MRKDSFELTPQQREIMEKRVRESAQKNPDFLPCAIQDARCGCVDTAGKPNKLFLTEQMSALTGLFVAEQISSGAAPTDSVRLPGNQVVALEGHDLNNRNGTMRS